MKVGLHTAELVQGFGEEDIMSCTETRPVEDGNKAGWTRKSDNGRTPKRRLPAALPKCTEVMKDKSRKSPAVLKMGK